MIFTVDLVSNINSRPIVSVMNVVLLKGRDSARITWYLYSGFISFKPRTLRHATVV